MSSTNLHVVHSMEAEVEAAPGAPTTGFETMLSGTSNINPTIGKVVSCVSFAFILVGIVLILSAFCINLKKKRSQKKRMSLNTKSRRQMAKVVYVSAFAMAAVGVGGVAYLKNQANADGIGIAGDLYATLVERDDNSSIYCGQDNLKISTANIQGYMIRMNGAVLESQSGEEDIVSIEDWGGLASGTWGFSTKYTKSGTASSEENSYVPIPNKNGVITNAVEIEGDEETIPVTFCAKIANDTPEGEYIGTVNYESTSYAQGFMLPDSAMIDYNSKGDSDGDGISDRKENQIGTNIMSDDTDFDMVSDSDELYLYHTDPFTEDTDGDTLTDYSEIKLGLNPNLQSTDGITKDKDREVTYTYRDEESSITLEMTGKGNLPEAYVKHEKPEVEGEDETGNIHVYSFQTDGDLTEAKVTMPYDPAEMAEVDDDNLVLYNVTEEDGLTYEEDAAGHNKIEVNKTNHTMTTTVKHFSEYTVGENDEENGELLGGMKIKAIILKIRDIICKLLQIIYPSTTCGSWGSSKPEEPIATVDYNNDGTDDVILADSGFDSRKNGLSFKNYGSQYYPGLCYGMAKFAEEYYTGKLELSREEGDPTLPLLNPSYDFSKVSGFMDQYNASKNLVDLVPDKTGTPGYLGLDLRRGTFLNDTNIAADHKKNPTAFTNTFRAIVNFFPEQDTDTSHMSNTDGDLSMTKFIEKITTRLNNNDPITIGVHVANDDYYNWIKGGHAVNATKLIRSGEDQNKYFVEFYDNNYPKETFYFDLECKPTAGECRASGNHKVGKSGTPDYHIDSDSPFVRIYDATEKLPVTRVD